MSPPHTIKQAILNPIHTLLYIAFVVSACALFSKTWIEVSGSGPREIAKQLKDQQMVMAGYRAILGLLSVAADLMGAIGSGMGILMAVQHSSGLVHPSSEDTLAPMIWSCAPPKSGT
ncbi:SecY subunit domain-containing protein [Suillus placidus]|uniref:SecY subunit domain-containing protein n=1 Tax=Suillus placidus TaxID=48579 RepID=A0A9P7D9N6_9AGAM|nr:SecY subunit domain-containing protein [Suillus placidus]